MKPELPIFVRNRVEKIRQLTSDVVWLHVGTKENPADLISRGVQPLELMKSQLWWNGPDFLSTIDIEMKTTHADPDIDEEGTSEEIYAETVALVTTDCRLYDFILKCSNFRKQQRIFGYVTRFIHNCRVKSTGDKRSGGLNSIDYRESLKSLVKIVQHVVYHEEIKKLQHNSSVKGKLANLNPIYEEKEKLLRVGGRIRHSDLPKDKKHPMILPEQNNFTDSVIQAIHREELHVGLNGLLAKLRQQFWPMNAKRSINRVLRNCVRCFRVNPRDVQQFMGDLPISRVTIAEPFVRTGVDYAGPFFLKQGRSKAPTKAYVSVFVCMCTKAIHFELVSLMTADAFLGALHRFVGRRGNVSEMHSDNGMNFRGAERQLTELQELLKSQMLESKMEEFCQPRGINWHFIPPRAPHQGGLWEAGVKSMKTHLYTVLNESYLSAEEMGTLLVQIEAILNSRPPR